MAIEIEGFYLVSSYITKYSVIELKSTGVGDEYCEVVLQKVPLPAWQQFAHCLIDGKKPCAMLETLEKNIFKLWYLSIWYPLTKQWYEQCCHDFENVSLSSFNVDDTNPTVISARAYQQGLVWRTLGSHPMGAQEPGFASWAEPPVNLLRNDAQHD